MFKKILCAGLLASTSLFAHAAVQSWTFSYAGFYDQENMMFDATRELSGSFLGEDLNRDGVLNKSELTYLTIGGVDFIECAKFSSPYYQCGADQFSYKDGGALNFAVSSSGRDPEGLIYDGHAIIAGDIDSTFSSRPGNDWSKTLRWTAETKFSITNTSPVPEPSTYAMLGLGLLGLAGLQSRRRRR